MTAPTSGDRPCIESRPHSAHEWHGYPPDVWRCPGVTAPTSLAETLAALLDVHRWKTMGVGSVKCECGQIIHGDASLTQFPADEAFRGHIAALQAEAARAWLVARLNEHGPPEVLVGALTNMIEAASQARDDCHDDLRRSWHQGRVSALMDAKRQTESWVAALTEVLTDD